MVLWPHQMLHTWKLQELGFEQTTSVYMLNLCNSPFSSHLFLCPLANVFTNMWRCCQVQGIRLGFYLISSFFVCCKLVLREKRLTPGSREALFSQAATNLWVPLKVERSKLQAEHLRPKCISLSRMHGGPAVNELIWEPHISALMAKVWLGLLVKGVDPEQRVQRWIPVQVDQSNWLSR